MSYILFVVDDAVSDDVAGRLLKEDGHAVLSASSGARALEILRSGMTGLDLVIMDLETCPDAIETARTLFQEFGLPLLFLYSEKNLTVLDDTHGLTSYGFIHKQSCPNALIASVRSALALQSLHAETRRATAAQRTSELQMRDLIEKMPDGVYKSTHEGRFIEVNPAMVKILGYDSKEDLMSIDIKKELYFTVTDRESAALEEKLEEMAVFRLRKKDGSEIWVEDHGSHIVDEHGNVLFHQGVLRDVTERIRSERQLLQAQKLDGIGTLAGGIAHDFNNLLAMILGSAELLHRQTTALPHLQKYVERIIQASERGTSISRQLLLFSRPDEAELKPISISHTIIEIEEMLRHFLPKSIVIETDTHVDNGMIMGDMGQIHQALMNLVLNASDAMQGHGKLTIREFSVNARNPHSTEPDGVLAPHIAVSVSDTGLGMEASVVGKIFDPFFSTKEPGKGTGLGLAIVHGIVKNHHGFIDVQSEPNKGSTFTLYFPAIPCKEQIVEADPFETDGNQTGTILLVDDERLIREMLVEFLEECGYTLLTAVNGADALRLFQANREQIDLVITDLGMPEIGGEELYHKLRELDRTVKVIVSSGYLDGSTKKDLLGIGVKEVLTKPYKFDEIKRVVRETINAN
ncbi:MAG TPA: response regulator [Bacteroidota bacterium]|nr:response regulator [Bacteroidota bacterium]